MKTPEIDRVRELFGKHDFVAISRVVLEEIELLLIEHAARLVAAREEGRVAGLREAAEIAGLNECCWKCQGVLDPGSPPYCEDLCVDEDLDEPVAQHTSELIEQRIESLAKPVPRG